MSRLVVRALGELAADSQLGLAWEALVTAHPASGFMQGLPWAAFRRQQGFRVEHLGVFAGAELVGGVLLYAPPGNRSGAILTSPDGPVLPWADEALAAQAMPLLHQAVEGWAGTTRAIGWRLEPRLPAPLPRCLRNFARAPVDLLPSESLLLDLTPEPAELLAAMHPKGRYNVRLAERHGVVVEVCPAGEGLVPLYELLQLAATRNDFFLEPRSFFAQLLETLGPGGHARVVLAGRGEEVLGAQLLLVHGRRATYLYGGTAGHDRHLMAGYALQWGAIREARALGCTTYDFYGFDPLGRPDHLYARFSRFKRQFGGTAVKYAGAHEHMFLDRLADTIVAAVSILGGKA